MSGDASPERDLREEFAAWHPVIGRGIVAFGGIELVTYHALRFLPGAPPFAEVVNMLFAKRVHRLLKLLAREADADRGRFAALLHEALALADIRNLIAHNPLMLTVYRSGPDEDWLLAPEIRHITDSQILDRAAIERFAADAERLHEALGRELFTLLHSTKLMKGRS